MSVFPAFHLIKNDCKNVKTSGAAINLPPYFHSFVFHFSVTQNIAVTAWSLCCAGSWNYHIVLLTFSRQSQQSQIPERPNLNSWKRKHTELWIKWQKENANVTSWVTETSSQALGSIFMEGFPFYCHWGKISAWPTSPLQQTCFYLDYTEHLSFKKKIY